MTAREALTGRFLFCQAFTLTHVSDTVSRGGGT